jgi:hypothetical protein
MESTEQIIEEYLRFVKKWFYLTDIKFKVMGPKGGSNYSNVDLIAIDEIKNKVYDIESKFRSAYKFSLADIKGLTDQLFTKGRSEAIRQFTKKKPIKVLVIFKDCFGTEKTGKFQKLEEEFRKQVKRRGFKSELWLIENLVVSLRNEITRMENKGRYDSGILQTIRLMNKIKDCQNS